MNDQADVLWLLRHGNREDFVDLDWAKTAARPMDPALSTDGREQAERTATRLQGEGIRHIFTSPYLRCAETAQIVAARVKAPVDVEPGLGELNDAEWSKERPVLLPTTELAARVGPFQGDHTPVLVPRFPETMDDAFERSWQTARGLLAVSPSPLLLVSHAVSIIGIARGLCGYQGVISCPVASLFRLERGASGWVLVLAGDTAHLDA